MNNKITNLTQLQLKRTDTFKLNNENDYISLENYTTFTVAHVTIFMLSAHLLIQIFGVQPEFRKCWDVF